MCFGSIAVEREVIEQKAETPAQNIRVFLGRKNDGTQEYVLVSFPKPGGGWSRAYVYPDGTSNRYAGGINPDELATFPWYTELVPD